MASWNGVTTNAGIRLMANWTGGACLTIVKAVAGTGTVSAVSLLAQQALVNERQTVSIVSGKIEGEARKIKIQIQAPDEAYRLNQIGLYASLDGGEPTLLALFQHEEGIPIPSAEESPDFAYTFYCFLKVSNQGNFSLNVDTSALVSYGTMREHVSGEIELHDTDEQAHKDIREELEKLSQKPFFVVSDTEPSKGPVLWFDTSTRTPDTPSASEQYILMLDLGGDDDEAPVAAIIDGNEFPAKNLSEPVANDTGDYSINVNK